jgi:Tol biopolymer transport system component
MSERSIGRLSDEQVDRLVASLATAPAAPVDAAARLFDELVPLARRARVRERSRVLRLWRLIGFELIGERGQGRAELAGTRVRLLVALMLVVAVVLATSLLLGGGSQPVPTPSPLATPPAVIIASPTPSAAPGWLAPFGYRGEGTIEYTNHDSAGNDVLWLVDPSGANARILVQGGCCGLFSPDGSQLALAAPGVSASGLSRDSSLLGIEVLDQPGGRTAFVVPTGCGACAVVGLNAEPDAWSPDGRYIALTMWSDSDPSAAAMALADRDFPIPWDWARSATGAHADIPIAFSPDSSHLLFMRTERTEGPTAIGPLFVLRIRDLSVRKISPPGVTVAANGLIQGPASWSYDGRTIVFAGTDEVSGRTSIFAVGASAGSAVQSLVADAPGATSARYSPHGFMIAFDEEQPDSPFHDLMVIQPDGSGLTNLTSTFDPGVCCGQWSPDGGALVVAGTSSDDSHNNLFIVAANGTGVWQVTNDPNVYTGFLWGRLSH